MGLERGIRHKRYKIKPTATAKLHLLSSLGENITATLVDCSLTGISAKIEPGNFSPESLASNSIIPSAKIKFDNAEITLGRLVVRRSDPARSEICAFSVIDGRIPLDGKLSTQLEQDFDDTSTEYDYELGPEFFNIAHFVETDYANIDILDRVRKFGVFFRDWKQTDRFGWYFKRMESQGSRVKLERKRKNGRNDYIMMGSNDYLGLASHPAVKEAAAKTLQTYGFGSTGTPPTSGHSDLHEALMEKLARMFGREAAVLFPSGFSTNFGAISAVCREGDLIVADILSHASICDGITMSRATTRFFKHNDMQHLEQLLAENRSKHNGCLIITEGAFSMDGSLGNLAEIHRLSRKYNARYYVDQAHCVGVVGKNGLGTVEKYDLRQEADIIMGLFSKSLGSVGGFVVGSKDLCDWLRVFTRSYLFATSLPPSTCAATLKSIEIMEQLDLVHKVQQNIKMFRDGLNFLGADIDPAHESAIFPVEIRDEKKMGQMFQSFLEDGIYVLPVVYPVVSRSRCRFRFSVRADHTTTDLDYVLSSLEKAVMKVGLSFDQIRELKEQEKVKRIGNEKIVHKAPGVRSA